MDFTAVNFKHLGPNNHPPAKIRLIDSSTLILVKKSGFAYYGRTRADKDKIVSDYADGDLLLFVWVGQHHTDIFHLTKTDIDTYYR